MGNQMSGGWKSGQYRSWSFKLEYTNYTANFKSDSWWVYSRVGSIGRDLIILLTQCRHMNPDELKLNNFLIRSTFNYLWASEVLKNQGFYIKVMNITKYKLVSNWNSGYIFIHTLVFISKDVQFLQFSKILSFQKLDLNL